MGATSMKEARKSRKPIAVLAAGGVGAAAILAAGTTSALWQNGFTFSNEGGGFSIVSASLSAQAGTGENAESNTVGDSVTATFADDDKEDLIANGSVALPVYVTGSASDPVGISYSLGSISASGIYATEGSTVRLVLLADGAECTTDSTGTTLYDGALAGASFDSQELVAQNNGGVASTDNLCAVLTVPRTEGTYTQNAQATGDTADGEVTADATVSGDTAVYGDTTGDLSLTFDWEMIR